MTPATSRTTALHAALAGRCPECGQGPMFAGYLGFAKGCTVCGADFSKADAGDGPAVFVMFGVGAIVVPLAFILQFAAGWPLWAVLVVVCTVATALSLALLRFAKGLLFALQWKHKAEEGRLEKP